MASGLPPTRLRGLSLPTQVSTTSRRPGASTSSAWIETFSAPSSGRTKLRIEPGRGLQRLRRRLRDERRLGAIARVELDLDDPGDLHPPDLPAQHAAPLLRLFWNPSTRVALAPPQSGERWPEREAVGSVRGACRRRRQAGEAAFALRALAAGAPSTPSPGRALRARSTSPPLFGG